MLARLARRIEPAEREHGGRALRENLHAKTIENHSNLEDLEAVLALLGRILAASWGILGAVWGVLAAVLGLLGGILGCLAAGWLLYGVQDTILDPFGLHFGGQEGGKSSSNRPKIDPKWYQNSMLISACI